MKKRTSMAALLICLLSLCLLLSCEGKKNSEEADASSEEKAASTVLDQGSSEKGESDAKSSQVFPDDLPVIWE